MINHALYREDVDAAAGDDLPWEKLADSTVLITGATGLIGTFLTDTLMRLNATKRLNCHVIAVARSERNAQARFGTCFGNPLFSFLAHDVREPLCDGQAAAIHAENVDYVIHLAANTHPEAYATDPVGTVMSGVAGTERLLHFAAQHRTRRFLFASSNEIYGENRGDTELFDEDYCGYLDCNTLRAGYPESKRCAEALCQAYRRQEGLNAVIARLSRSYGPTLRPEDTKALSQFLHRGAEKQDIVLKSDGTQIYSYTYMADAVTGLLTVLLRGEDGAAYNVADPGSDIPLRELAALVAELAGTRVVSGVPGKIEQAGFSRATKARLDGSRLMALGWNPRYSLRAGLSRTLEILRENGYG